LDARGSLANGSHLQFWLAKDLLGSGVAELSFSDFSGGAGNTARLTIETGGLTAPGDFRILGVSGGADSTVDSILPPATQPTVSWSAAFGAASYEVTLYQDNGSTVQCPARTVTAAVLPEE